MIKKVDICSFADRFHFYVDPDPRDNIGNSGSGSGERILMDLDPLINLWGIVDLGPGSEWIRHLISFMNVFLFPDINNFKPAVTRLWFIYRVSQKKLSSKNCVMFVLLNFFVNSILKKLQREP